MVCMVNKKRKGGRERQKKKNIGQEDNYLGCSVEVNCFVVSLPEQIVEEADASVTEKGDPEIVAKYKPAEGNREDDKTNGDNLLG